MLAAAAGDAAVCDVICDAAVQTQAARVHLSSCCKSCTAGTGGQAQWHISGGQGMQALAGASCTLAHLMPVLPSVTVAQCPSAFIATAPSALPGSSCCCMRAPLLPLFTRPSMGAAPAPAALVGPPMPRAPRLPRRGGGVGPSSHLQGRLGGRAMCSWVQAEAGVCTGQQAYAASCSVEPPHHPPLCNAHSAVPGSTRQLRWREALRSGEVGRGKVGAATTDGVWKSGPSNSGMDEALRPCWLMASLQLMHQDRGC